jgi:hypothetical protein
MPSLVVLLVVAFLAVGVGLLVLPVSEAKLYGFGVWHALDLPALGQSRLSRYLARRRRMRTAGVLVAAAIGLAASIQNDRVEVQFVPLMTGWLVGAIAAEVTQRQIATGISEPVGVPLRWRYVPAITAVVVVVWTASAVLLRGEGAEPGPLVLWGGAALLPLLAVVLASRRVVATAPHGIGADSEKLESAIVDDGVRGMTMGGVILAVFCIARVWSTAVPGPYEEPSELPITLGLAVIAILVLLNVVPALRISRPGWGWLVFAAVALLPLAWAVPVKVAQQPPITAAEAHAIAQVRLARLDGLAAVRDSASLENSQSPDISVTPMRRRRNSSAGSTSRGRLQTAPTTGSSPSTAAPAPGSATSMAQMVPAGKGPGVSPCPLAIRGCPA